LFEDESVSPNVVLKLAVGGTATVENRFCCFFRTEISRLLEVVVRARRHSRTTTS